MKLNNKKKTIKSKISLLMIVNVVVIIVLICLFNTFFFEDYYFSSKQHQLELSYHRLCSYVEEYEGDSIGKVEFEGNVGRLCERYNISAIAVKSDWTILYASSNDSNRLRERMMQNLLGHSGASVIKMEKDYTLQKVYDYKSDDEYLEIFGYVDSDTTLFMRLPIKSITDTTALLNSFVIRMGIIFVIIAMVSAYFLADRISKPVKRISTLAERMSDIKFDERYKGNDDTEIGVLGNSLNKLADRLDLTISELKTANNQLMNDIHSKEQQEIARVDFIANVSHELKTPIALIQGYAEGLKDGIYDSQESAEYYCNVIIDEAQKMNSMVKKLLTLNQLESGDSSVIIEKFNITELVTAIADANKLRAKQQGITVNVHMSKPIMVWADEFKIEEVITNYITNAINHCGNEKVVDITADTFEESVRINVKNTGVQIPEEDIDRIWEKFYKVDKARTREYGGNGIGLSIVKAIMEAHNKSYGVRNCDDGVEFWFELDTKWEV